MFGARGGQAGGESPIGLHQIHLPRGARSPLFSQLSTVAGLCVARRMAALGVNDVPAAQMRLADGVHGVTAAQVALA